MGIHLVVNVENESFNVTLSRDEAGNYVADATGPLREGRAVGASVPIVRVVDANKENVMKALLDSLHRATGSIMMRSGSDGLALG
jgi:hypothetical protein